ncbi:unnamed protein product [Effrenium voratum]|nr:unnamed protein product [Effrenium voratum]
MSRQWLPSTRWKPSLRAIFELLVALNIFFLLASTLSCWLLVQTSAQHHQNVFNLFDATSLGRLRQKAGASFLRPKQQAVEGVHRTPCSSHIIGPIPTTLPLQHNASCSWKELSGAVFTDPVGSELGLEEAKTACAHLGNHCRGVSCGDTKACRPMTGHQLARAGATSYLKHCLLFGEENVEATELPPAARLVSDLDAAIIVLAHNRPDDLAACLHSLLRLDDVSLFDLFVSLDDGDAYSEMRDVVIGLSREYRQKIAVWFANARPVDAEKDNQEQQRWFLTSTGKIAHHYWLAFEKVFTKQNYDFAIFVEEDLVLAPDFLAFFRSSAWLLAEDPSIWCVSAWNDAGFAFAVSDQCRLFRSTYFPGLGFMLRREAWLSLRRQWPSAPTMGWDYWMRVAFRQADKECIVPEVPRSRHGSKSGSSIVTDKQVQFFESMALAQLRSSCSSEGPCNHFGNVDYILQDNYEAWMMKAAQSAHSLTGSSQLALHGQECNQEAIDLGAQDSADSCAALVGMGKCSNFFSIPNQYMSWGCRCCEFVEGPVGKPHDEWSIYTAARVGDPDLVYLYPYTSETYLNIAPSFGLQPEGMDGVIPSDVRAEHYGLVVGRHLTSQAVVLLADRRSSKDYLPVPMRARRNPKLLPTPSAAGQSCDDACKEQGMSCSADQLHFMNECGVMMAHFGCKFCAHQAGLELPAYVVDDFQPTFGQCLVTLISALKCDSSHPATRRLCACLGS